MSTIDLSSMNSLSKGPAEKNGYAIFIPSISPVYLKNIGRKNEAFRDGCLPASIDGTLRNLNFLDSQCENFFYKWGLYSAGHTKGDFTAALGDEQVLRNRQTGQSVIMADSGGFQIARQQWQIDVTNPEALFRARESVLKWAEGFADIIVPLDFPTNEAVMRQENFDFASCLRYTEDSLEFMVNQRDRTTKALYLNVLQGADWGQAKDWFSVVKRFDSLDGWSIPWRFHENLHSLLQFLLIMKHDGALDNCRWLHFFGVARLNLVGGLTLLMRALREHVRPDLVVSYDAASPFISGGRVQQAYSGLSFRRDGEVVFEPCRVPNSAHFVHSNKPFPFATSPIGREMKLGDLCALPEGKRRQSDRLSHWDTLSSLMLMNHNLYVHIDAINQLNRIVDVSSEFDMGLQLPKQYQKLAEVLDRIFARGQSREQANQIVLDNKNVLEFFDRSSYVTVAQLIQGERPDWWNTDLEPFPYFSEVPWFEE